MSITAIIGADAVVTNVILLGDEPFDPGEGFSLVAIDEADPQPGIGWSFAGGVFSAPPPLPAPPVDLLAYAAARRWQVEVGGITVAGVPVATDDRSKIMIMGARVAAMADSGWSTIWHGADGQTYPVDAAAMIAISDAVQAHVNAGFATFAAVKADIDAGEITTTVAIDAAFAEA